MRDRRITTLAICVAIGSLFSCSKRDTSFGVQVVSAAPYQAPNRGPTKLALLIGINKYRYSTVISPLDGAVNDVEDMKAVLIGKFDFPPENILVLIDEQATHAGIINAIQTHLIGKAQRDDITVIHFSGHGSQMKDVTGKMISGLDETIVPQDSRDPHGKVFDISGAELHGLLMQLSAKTKNITFVLDSCHSGTLVKGPGSKIRSVVPDTRTPPPLPSYATGARGLHQSVGDATGGYTVIAAATSRENAFEHFADRTEHGALTYFLTRQLRTARAGATYRDIMDPIIANVNANYPSEHPQLEGAEADQVVFGDATSAAQTYIPVSAADKVYLSFGAGQVQGLTAGSLFDIYPPGTKRFDASQRATGRAQLTDVRTVTADGKILSGAAQLASRAVEREHQYGTRKFRVYFDGLQSSPALQAIVPALQPYKQIEVTEDSRSCNLQVRQNGNRIVTLAADGVALSTPVPVGTGQTVKRVSDQINSWSKWFNILSLRNAQPGLTVEFTVRTKKDGVSQAPLLSMARPDSALRAGDGIEASIKNSSDRDLYVSMLDLSSDGSISVVYPADGGQAAVLKPELAVAIEFDTFVPPGRSIVEDVLKVLASTKPINLAPLSQSTIRDPNEDPIGSLLETAVGLERGFRPTVKVGDWVTAQRLLVIRKK